MIVKTDGIVLNSIKYKETSLIVKIFTKELGLRSYIVPNVRSAKPKFSQSYFQPLQWVDLVVYDKPNLQLQRISDMRPKLQMQHIYQDYGKVCVVSFLAEVLSMCLHDESDQALVFDAITDWLSIYEEHPETGLQHLHFLFKLGKYLGFEITESAEILHQLGYSKGTEAYLNAIVFLEACLLQNLDQQIQGNFHNQACTDLMVKVYQLHIPNFKEPKSLDVIRSMM